MGFRLYKRFSVVPGVRINVSKSGPSLSLGPRGMHYTIGRRGRRTTVGLPGTGMSYTHYHPWGDHPSPTGGPPSMPPTATPVHHGPLWWIFVFPIELLAYLAAAVGILLFLGAVALIGVALAGFLAVLFGWSHTTGVTLAVLLALFSVGFVVVGSAEGL